MSADTTSPDSDKLSDQEWLAMEAKRLAELRAEGKPTPLASKKLRYGERQADAPREGGMPYSVVQQGRHRNE
jgi:hypothetical protein